MDSQVWLDWGDDQHHADIVVGFFGSSWRDIRGYSIVDLQDQHAISVDVM